MKLSEITTADAALVAAYQKFTTRTHQSESFSFWFDKGNNEAKYVKYIKKGSPKEINIEDSLVKEFDAKAATGHYNDMNPEFVKARAEVLGMLEPRLAEFLTSPEHKEYELSKKAGNITKALKVLGLTGSNLTTMTTLMKQYAVAASDSDKKSILAKMEKVAKHEQLVAALKSSGLL